MRDEVRASPNAHLVWTWCVALLDEDGPELERIDRAVRRIAAMPDVEVTIDPWWFAVAAPSRRSHRVRSTMRRLVRDGLLREADRFSRPATVCTHPRCSRCGPHPGR